MNKRIVVSLIGLAVIFFVVSLLIFLRSKDQSGEKIEEQAAGNNAEISEETSVARVRVFFLTEDSQLMRPVERELRLTGNKEQGYKQFVDLLFKGQPSYITPIPEGIELRSLYYVGSQKMVVLDFSEELLDRFPSGTESELEFIYFIVDNLCYNFKEIEKVKFLIAGNEFESISGHIDLEEPFYPDYKYIYAPDQQ